eukprot:CAMPEP_0170244924 /NCGR_PEP_ID=MMETSP0116_2-20130129/22243_1 /TAXON_ID=400756 /ORGANISM="Durinskia baltica, Strain CSIRO CS-38" /LENGTH=529 /DNA_ID=CAMNT_0010495789 /DNA_START=111 /DNA_END=1700 /DNA_ORIENTATION=+
MLSRSVAFILAVRGTFILLIMDSFSRLVHGANCFRMRTSPEASTPFSDMEIAKMRSHLLANMNIDGTGAMIASPGLTPALIGNPPLGYHYDWQRDSGLTMFALLRLADTSVAVVGGEPTLSPDLVDRLANAYVQWVATIVGKDGSMWAKGRVDAHGEAKWDISQRLPFGGGWCRPQTDGPALRAQALMSIANRSNSKAQRREIWELIKFDLDWVADVRNIHANSCDLWEEQGDGNLFWNRMSMRGALIMGHYVAQGMNDLARAQRYLQAARLIVGNPVTDHLRSPPNLGPVITECANDAPLGGECKSKGKDLDGAVLLALIHSGWVDYRPVKGLSLEPADSPTSVAVANTVRAHIATFCHLYPINQHDSARGVPGVLLGRFPRDMYGGGNPWVLTTAALASLLYQASRAVSWDGALSASQLDAWRLALNQPSFSGTASDFRLAGDSVLLRLKSHVEVDGFHFYEQISKATGDEYNAKDLSWSYVEILSALGERDLSMQWAEVSARRLHEHSFATLAESEDAQSLNTEHV